MDRVRRAEDLLRQAWALMMPAERMNLKQPDLMGSCRQAFTLYAQALYHLLDLDFPESLGGSSGPSAEEAQQSLGREAKRLSEASLPLLFPYKEDLPKIAFLAFFWSTFSGYAAQACQEAALGQRAVFGKDEASCAVSQAKHCHKMIKSLIDLKKG